MTGSVLASGDAHSYTPSASPDAMSRTTNSPQITSRTVPGPVPENVTSRRLQLDFHADVVRSADVLADRLTEWASLAGDCVEPNIFFEPCVVLPALLHSVSRQRPEFVLIWGRERDAPNRPPLLCGLFPLLRRRFSHGMPVASWTMWGHTNCFLRTPLIRRGFGEEVLDTFFGWLDQQSESLIEFQQVSADGPFHKLLADVVDGRNYLSWVAESFTRALLVRQGTDESYLREAVTGKHLKELRRQESRLAEQGPLTYECLAGTLATEQWTNDFLRLEAAGWKGRERTAFDSDETNRAFFRELVAQAATQGKLQALSLKLNGRTLASKCNLLTGRASFAFKICFDEGYGRFSPGVLLEIENIRRFFAEENLLFMDSCAAPHHSMINRLWKDRRSIQSLLVSTGRLGDVSLSASPLLRWAKRSVWPRRGR